MAEVKVYCKYCGTLLQKWTAPGTAYMPRISKCEDYNQKCKPNAKKAVEGNLITGKVRWQE